MRVFITGLTGTLGTALAKQYQGRWDEVYGCSRNEATAVKWSQDNPNLAHHYLSDASRLGDWSTDVGRILPTMDMVIHCAAMKHVELCEQFPEEAFQQNVELTRIVASSCKVAQVSFILVSSDKACLPNNVYGATKLLAERITLNLGGGCVRLGNIIGSSGSVLHKWKECVENLKPISLTNPQMTRFFIPIEEAASFIVHHAKLGCVTIPRNMKAARIGEIAETISEGVSSIGCVGLRPGETMDQWLVAPGDLVVENDDTIRLSNDAKPQPHAGICSAWAEKWDIRELLKIAGV